MLFDRLKVLWLGFWSSILGKGERNQTLMAQGSIETHKAHLRNVRDALTNLIFQKKKLGDQLAHFEDELAELKKDTEQAAAENRDELALNLIARLEAAQEERNFLKDQLATVLKDIELARETEKQLAREIVQAEQMLGTLTSRYQHLKVRKQLQNQLQSLSATTANATKLHQPLADQIRRLEAEMETLQVKREIWEKDWQQMRERRSKTRHQAVLDQIKQSVRRNTMPAVIVASPAT
jgi:phage shock protein A